MSTLLHSVSVSGPPGIGLFFQLEQLVHWTSRTPLIYSISYTDSSIQDLGKRDVVAQRWLNYEGSSRVTLLPNEEFVRILAVAAWNRHNRASKPDIVPAFYEDGLFYEAVCTARIALVSSISIEDANRELHRILRSKSLSFPRATVRILLFWENFATLDPDDPNGPGKFEALLFNSLYWQQANHQYNHVILRRDATQDTYHLHRVICERINNYLNGILGMDIRRCLLPLWNSSICVAVAGLYYSGKSSISDALISRASQSGFSAARVQTSYLLDKARNKYPELKYKPRTPYWPALGIIKEMDHYLRTRNPVSLIFLELDGIARFDYAREIKKWMGGRSSHFLLVYVDASFPVRFERALSRGKLSTKEDEIDADNEVPRIKDFADVVVNNSGDMASFMPVLRQMICDRLIEIGAISSRAAAKFVEP